MEFSKGVTMICEKCNKNEATIHLVKIVNGKKEHLMICEECASEMGDLIIESEERLESNLDFHKILSGLVEYINKEEKKNKIPLDKTCPICKTTYEEFKNTESFGCSNCYEIFEEGAISIIRKFQGSSKHIGKIPEKLKEAYLRDEKIKALKISLDEAINFEDYERAAFIRDEIKKEKNIANKEEQDG